MNKTIIEVDGKKYQITPINFVKGINVVKNKYKNNPALVAKILIQYFEQLIANEISMEQIYAKTRKFIENIPILKEYQKFKIIDDAYKKFLESNKEDASEGSEELKKHYQCIKACSSDYRKQIYYIAYGKMFISYCEGIDEGSFETFSEKLGTLVKEMDIAI